MSEFTEKLNFSVTEPTDSTAIKLFAKNRDGGYYYDNLCLYCANNDVDLADVTDEEFSAASDLIEEYGSNSQEIDSFYFWID